MHTDQIVETRHTASPCTKKRIGNSCGLFSFFVNRLKLGFPFFAKAQPTTMGNKEGL